MVATERPVRVVIQDGSRLFREGLARLIDAEPQWSVVACVGQADELLERCGAKDVDAALFEDGAVTARLPSINPGLRLAATTTARVHAQPPGDVTAVARTARLEEFLRALSPSSALGDQAAEPVPLRSAAAGGLSSGELQVLVLLSAGMGTEQIAARLRVSTKTVEKHRQRMFSKLGVQSQSQAVAAAFRTGLLGVSTVREAEASPPPSASGPRYHRPAVRVHRFVPGLPKVVVVHDHRWLAELLRCTMAGSIDLVGESTFGEVALALCDLVSPDVVIMSDMLADGMIDHFLTPLLRTGARLMMLTNELETARSRDLIERGVMGIVDFDVAPVALSEAVMAIALGGAVLPSQVAGSIVGDWRITRRSRAPESATALTSREREVLNALADGLSTKAVARSLGIAVKTVENHKTRIFDKLGVKTQFHAVALLLEGRVVAEPPPPSLQQIVE
jgi:DNA-binding NarL/FixJ family response regulator